MRAVRRTAPVRIVLDAQPQSGINPTGGVLTRIFALRRAAKVEIVCSKRVMPL